MNKPNQKGISTVQAFSFLRTCTVEALFKKPSLLDVIVPKIPS